MINTLFWTATELDLRAFTVLGINSKPNSNNPIGFFGTGLKYALAVLVREGIEPILYIKPKGKPLEKYIFYTKDEEFRDKNFSFIYMKKGSRNKWFTKEIQLPFTTEFGKNWGLWQAFRELYSNTLDEGGAADTFEGEYEPDDTGGSWTEILVPGEDFANEYEERDKTFLPSDLIDTADEYMGVQRIDRPSAHIYYRGFRAYDLEKESKYTWNIISELDLTEDRTIKFYSTALDRIKQYCMNSKDETFLDDILNLDDKWLEHKFDFDDWRSPGFYFSEYVSNNKVRNQSAKALVYKHSTEYVEAQAELTWEEKLINAIKEREWYEVDNIIEENESTILEMLQERIDNEY